MQRPISSNGFVYVHSFGSAKWGHENEILVSMDLCWHYQPTRQISGLSPFDNAIEHSEVAARTRTTDQVSMRIKPTWARAAAT